MFEFVMVLCFAYAGFSYLLPGTEERGAGGSEGKRNGGENKTGGTTSRLRPRGRSCRKRNEAAPKRPLLSQAG
jgi:hypothetical protein